MSNSVDIFERQGVHRTNGRRLAALTVPMVRQATSVSAGRREIQLALLTRATDFDAVARNLRKTPRTLRRRLRDEDTPFRMRLS